MIAIPAPVNIEKEANFARGVEAMYEKFGKGGREVRTQLNNDLNCFADTMPMAMTTIQNTLDDFYMGRIGIRMVGMSTACLLYLSLKSAMG